MGEGGGRGVQTGCFHPLWAVIRTVVYAVNSRKVQESEMSSGIKDFEDETIGPAIWVIKEKMCIF